MKPILISAFICGTTAAMTLCEVAKADSVTYAGTQVGGWGNGWVVENWSNPSVAKSHDADGDNFYGSAGYAQLLPMTPPGSGV